MRELITILIAATPVFELRGSIPLAVAAFDFSVSKAFLLSVVGNLIPIIVLLLLLPILEDVLSKKSQAANRFLSWIFERTRRKHSKRINNWGLLGLFTLTAIPLPMTGAWTASILAFLFKVPFTRAFTAISLGVIVAGFIVAGVISGIIYFI